MGRNLRGFVRNARQCAVEMPKIILNEGNEDSGTYEGVHCEEIVEIRDRARRHEKIWKKTTAISLLGTKTGKKKEDIIGSP